MVKHQIKLEMQKLGTKFKSILIRKFCRKVRGIKQKYLRRTLTNFYRKMWEPFKETLFYLFLKKVIVWTSEVIK